MATYILFWNPAISSYTMERFLDDYENHDGVGNWSFYEHEDVKYGDIFYMVRCGEGNAGIVMRGLITSECYEDEDWSPKKRKKIYYADIENGVTINPETASVMLSPDALTEKIPDFNWFGGHSGRKLSEEDAMTLDQIWLDYIDSNPQLFANDEAHIDYYNGLLLSQTMEQSLRSRLPGCCEICGYDYVKVFGEETAKELSLNNLIVPKVGNGLYRLIFSICRSCNSVNDDVIIKTLMAKK